MNDEKKASPTTASKDIWEFAKAPMDASVRLSFERTMLSHERTLMAWIRTAVSLITFGFTIYKFFELELGAPMRDKGHQVLGARQFAGLMIVMGLLGLLLAAMQNRQHRQHLRKSGLATPLSYTTLAAVLIAALGVLALLAVIFRW